MNIWEERIKAMKDEMFQKSLRDLMLPQAIGRLRHEPTGYAISIYKPIPRFQRLMLRWCFGLKYEKYEHNLRNNRELCRHRWRHDIHVFRLRRK